MSTRKCSACERMKPEESFTWVADRYGNPYRKVCAGCAPALDAEIAEWVFDPADAGEALDPDDY